MEWRAESQRKANLTNFVWEEIKVGFPGAARYVSQHGAVGVISLDTYHRSRIPHRLIRGAIRGCRRSKELAR